MADLISIDRAMAQIPAATESDLPLIASLVSGASDVIESKCNRQFAFGAFDELHTVQGATCSIWVNNPPITSITAVRSSELPALYVQNSDPQNQAQYATVEITATGIALRKMLNNALVTNVTLDWAAYPTFLDLGNQVNTLGNGWSAQIPTQFQKWQTSDLTTNHGTTNCRNITLPLTVYWWWSASHKANKELGEIIMPGGGLRGGQVYRVAYTGGFKDVPEAVQQACAELVQVTFASRNQNALMASETLDKYSYTRAALNNWDLLSLASKQAIGQYRNVRYGIRGVDAYA